MESYFTLLYVTSLSLAVYNQVTDAERSKWVAWFKRHGEEHVVLTDARSGKGVNRVREVALLVSRDVNAKREAKGLMPRPVRTAVIGYPNVGGAFFHLHTFFGLHVPVHTAPDRSVRLLGRAASGRNVSSVFHAPYTFYYYS